MTEAATRAATDEQHTLVALRLSGRLRLGPADEATERRTLRAVTVTFFALAGYLTVEGRAGW